MKSTTRVSAWVVFAALVCFAPYAIGQSTVKVNMTVAGNSVLNNAPSALLTFAPGPGDLLDGDHGKKGCSGGDGGWGWDRSSGDKSGDKKCGGTAVPEGGTSLMYVSLAGLCCLGAMVYRLRRHARASETN
ncbi:MAG: hypothetical protein WBV26_00840 [Candidatus Sulfotelmatobacter sp.]|jgi:hypothetical protein